MLKPSEHTEGFDPTSRGPAAAATAYGRGRIRGWRWAGRVGWGDAWGGLLFGLLLLFKE